MTIIGEHIVPDLLTEIRLVDYLPGIFDLLPSKSATKKALKRKEILVDGEMAIGSRWVLPNQKIQLLDSERNTPEVFELPLEIVFEDDYLAVINKPAGFPVSGNQFRTIQNALPFNLKKSICTDALKLPRPVHRLDVPTSGLLVIAKTAKTLMKLGQQLEKKEFDKRYRAIVAGKLPEEGLVAEPIKGQSAKTIFRLVQYVPSLKTIWLSLVDLYPLTGRTHQLRKHMSGLGFPIVGDKMYCKDAPLLKGKGLFLSAVELKFKHPVGGELMCVKMNDPEKFKSLFEREKRRWKKYH
jgi:RluA family pseudouridine synthase